MYLKRDIEKELILLSKQYSVVTITGPRQSGKTTLAKNTFPKKKYLNLENPDLRELAMSDPRSFFDNLPDGAIIDEFQRVPELLSYIQVIVDEKKKKGMFILTGSQQFEMMTNVSQSLAGRTAILKLLPLSIAELMSKKKTVKTDSFLYFGFYPGVHVENLNPTKAYRNYYETYIERDLRQLINIKELRLFQKFIRLCAGRIGQLYNASNLSNEVGVSVPTINSWLSVLQASYIVFLLEPYNTNVSKRLVKSPKLYFYDVGLASYLLEIENEKQLSRDPLRGSLFENMIVMEFIKYRFNLGLDHNLSFYRDNHGNEVDIVYKKKMKIFSVEIKSAKTFNKDFLKNLQYFRKVFADKVEGSFLVYDGDLEQSINDCKLVNFRNIISSIE